MTSLPAQLPAPPPGRLGWPWAGETPPPAYDARAPWPRITIITPSFNQGQFIEETIRSVLLQGYPNLEYIVIDGGSTDDTVEIIKKYEPWLAYWVSERDRGQSHAINKGLARASGEWFNWLNSDDYLLPGALFELARCATPEARIIAGRTHNLHGGTITGTYGSRWNGDMPDSLFFLGVNQPGSLLRLDAVQAAGGVREDLHYTMDLDLWLRLLLRSDGSSFVQTAAPVAVYRYHETSKTCSGHDIFAGEELSVLVDLFRALVPEPVLPTLDSIGTARPFATSNTSAWETSSIVRSLLARLVVNDSLLFRGLWRQTGDSRKAMIRFRGHLRQLKPDLEKFYADEAPAIRAKALLHAMEATRALHLSAAFEALRLAPTARLFRALIRLAIRPAKP